MRRHPRRQERHRFQAPEPVRQGVRRHFGAIGKSVAAGLILLPRPRTELHVRRLPKPDRLPWHRGLAVLRPPAQGNGVAERFIRTPKENLLWVRHFETIEELRLAPPGISPPGTIPIGWSAAMATGHLLRSEPTSNQPSIRPHEHAAACLTTVAQYIARVYSVFPSAREDGDAGPVLIVCSVTLS